LRSSAQTMDTLDRQKIVRLLVKDVLVSDDSIVIRHSIPVSPEPPAGGNLPPSGRSNPNGGGSYLLRSGRDLTIAGKSLHAPVRVGMAEARPWATPRRSARNLRR
jgi:site-specific DNA recombinase